MKLAHRTAIGIIAGLVISTVPFIGTASAETASWSCFHHHTAEKRFAKKMNIARSKRNISKMNLDKQLSRVARKHSAEMAQKATIYHSSNAELGRLVTRWSTLSENVGRGSTVSGTHSAFMKSDGHRYNILYGKFTHVGVGTVKKNGIIYVSVVFEGSRDPGTTLNPPSC